IGVDEKMQGEGIGNSMVLALKNYAKIHGYKNIFVGTQLMNKGAMQFYQKQGFVLESVYTVYHYWPGREV
ncbi:MAG: GNAT family N-acetyltransferase, partial [Cellulosilyticaceae bacterium]